MAFEKIQEYTQQLYDEIVKLERKIIVEPDSEKRKRSRSEASALFEALRWYYETVLQMSKFKSQREHCREIMEKLNPAWCQGYFKTSKKKK